MPRYPHPDQHDSSLETRGFIIGCKRSGMSTREIAEHVGLSCSTVNRWIKRSEENLVDHPLRTKPKSGRPRILTPQDLVRIDQFVNETPFTNSVQIKEQLNLNCGVSTIKRRLNEDGLHARVPATKIALNPDQARARLEFCQANLDRNWENAIFTDEKCFMTSQDTPIRLIWRRNGTRYEQINVRPNRSSGRISLGYWGWMSRDGPGEVVQITPPRFNARVYLQILEDIMLPTVRTLYPADEMPTIIYVEDNCRIHKANMVRDWFEDHPEFEVLQWPSKSPDLNPIENLWGQMIKHWGDPFEGVRVRTAEALNRNVLHVWNLLRGRNYCRNMVDNMRN